MVMPVAFPVVAWSRVVLAFPGPVNLNVFRSIIFPHYYKTATSPFSAVGATSSLLTPQRRLPEEFVCQDERDGTVLGVPLQRAQP